MDSHRQVSVELYAAVDHDPNAQWVAGPRSSMGEGGSYLESHAMLLVRRFRVHRPTHNTERLGSLEFQRASRYLPFCVFVVVYVPTALHSYPISHRVRGFPVS